MVQYRLYQYGVPVCYISTNRLFQRLPNSSESWATMSNKGDHNYI